MNRILGIFALVIATSLQASGENIKCKCDEVPFKPDPPCVRACVVSIMKNADMNILTAKVSLTDHQESSLEMYRNKPVRDGFDLDGKKAQKHNLYQVEKKLYSLPSDQLKTLILTAPPENWTVVVPLDQLDYYKRD
ncbi:hypothetical protein EI969_17545 [Pseudomonas sp. PB101]|uniref:hypothetical protein n=1 Tax=Pseudomonas sp. PB101 TaxID=2495428 RepID=UPI0013664E7C|nr:hypothetical protein [Pseudomonas sp. PB101]MVW87724.1 hypothetical protein [Pseudomonas sp. PB101]